MALYYIDATNGKDDNDGLSPDRPLSSNKNLKPAPGDSVLFKRGTFIRDSLYNIGGTVEQPITYGAYGEGELPIFCGSYDISSPEYWKEVEENIWEYIGSVNDETGNIVFNDAEHCGTLRWSVEELCEQGDFFDNCFGYRCKNIPMPAEHRFYVYSVKNPGLYYTSIECVTYKDKVLANNGSNMIIENLKFINCGCCAVAGEYESRNLTVRHCVFEHIGGCVWDADQKIRYGNGVECWNIAENVQVLNCYFEDIYDSGVTHQGMAPYCKPADGFIVRNCVFKKCGMAAYEQRDVMPLYAEFCDNICIDAGEGFSKQGEIMPRFSEIWPQPMGHHIFLWRIESETPGGSVKIQRNIFHNAPYGAAIYSIIAREAEDQTLLEDNVYYTENPDLLCRWHGKDFRFFEDFSKCDKNACYQQKI